MCHTLTTHILYVKILIMKMEGVFIMSSVNMTIRMDKDTKEKAQSLFSKFGLDMTTAINMFLKQSIREEAIPFSLTLHVPNKETIKAINDVRDNRNMSKTFSSVEELMEDLNA